MSGTNTAWVNYAYDFGNNQYEKSSKARWEADIPKLAQSGMNSIRVWVHAEGANTPHFDGNGYVTGTDRQGTLISDLKHFLDICKRNNILVNLVLWNGALMRNNNYKNLYWDQSKLQSYIDNALIPMVKALRYHPALAAWEPLNEPEGRFFVPKHG